MSQVTPDLRANLITIEAQSVTVGERQPAASKEERRRYVTNSLVFAVTMLLLTLWFEGHLKAFVTQRAVIGTVTLFAVWQAALSIFQSYLGKGEAAAKRLLGRPGILPHLGFALGMAVLLLVMTRSVYLQLGNTDARDVKVQVADARTGVRLDDLHLDADHKLAGGPFLALATRKLRLTALTPPGYKPVELSLSLFHPTQTVSFPFEPKKYYVFRILPAVKIKPLIPEPDDDTSATLSVDAGARHLATVPKFCRHDVLYIGAPEDFLSTLAAAQEAEFMAEYRHKLASAGITRSDLVESHIAAILDRKRTHFLSLEFAKGERLTITLMAGGQPYVAQVEAQEKIASVYVGD